MLSTLTQRATLRARTLTPDGGGGFAKSWDDVACVWIALHTLGAAEVLGGGRLESRVRHRIDLRRRADLAAGQHLETAGRSFRVHAVLDAGPRNAYVSLLCEELT